MSKKFPTTEFFDRNLKPIDKLTTEDGVKSFIDDQKIAIKEIEKNQNCFVNVINEIYLHLKKNPSSRIVYSGAGTSGRIGVQDGVELYPTFGWPKKRVQFILAGGNQALTESIEGIEDDKKAALKEANKISLNKNDVVICIAASGNTPFTLEVLKIAKQRKAFTLAVSNNPNGEINKVAKFKIILDTKGEIVAGSTRLKAGTSQKVCLNLISTMIMVKFGNVKNGLMINLVPNNTKLKNRKKMIDQYFEKFK